MDDTKAMPAQMVRAAEYDRTTYFIKAPLGHTLDDVLTPEWWRHNANRFKQHDVVEVVALDGSFDLTARVIAVKPFQVFLRPILRWTREESPEMSTDEAGGLVVSFAPRQKWRITTKTGEILEKDIATKEEAIATRNRLRIERMAA